MIENGKYYIDFDLERKYDNKNIYGFPNMLIPSKYIFCSHTDIAVKFIQQFVTFEVQKNKRYELSKEEFENIKNHIDEHNNNSQQKFSYIWT